VTWLVATSGRSPDVISWVAQYGAGVLPSAPRVGWRDLIVVGLITAVGFTVALFFATGVLAAAQLLRETKMGVLLGLGAAGLAFAAARALRVGRFAR
jgi:Na+:H+ antiporter, NhaA family